MSQGNFLPKSLFSDFLPPHHWCRCTLGLEADEQVLIHVSFFGLDFYSMGTVSQPCTTQPPPFLVYLKATVKKKVTCEPTESESVQLA